MNKIKNNKAVASPKSNLQVKTKRGTFSLEATSKGLFAVHFPGSFKMPPRRKSEAKGIDSKRLLVESQKAKSHLAKGAKALQQYFKGNRNAFSAISFDLQDQPNFSKKVLEVLRKVRPGKVVTYGELAKKAGFPRASRAVGSVMSKNRLPIIYPCHRVVLSDGSLGNYSGGISWKRQLLSLEGITPSK